MEKILIVDDERSIRVLLQRILEDYGYQCLTASNVGEARDLLATQPFDLLLSDLNMPGESGLDLITYVKEAYPDTAVVIVSVVADPKKVKEILELDVYGYIVKPFESSQVLISVANALRHNRLELHAKAHQETLEKAVHDRTQELRDLVVKLEEAKKESDESAKLVKDQLLFVQTLLDSLPNPIFYKDTNGLFLGCNSTFESFVGLRREEIIGKSVYEVARKDLADIYHETDLRLIRDGGKDEYEVSIDVADGSRRDVIINKSTYPDSRGNVAGLVGAILDITQRKESERKLSDSEARFKAVWNSLLTGIVVIDEQTQTIIDANPQAVEIIGLPREQIVGNTCRILCPSEVNRCPVTDLGQTIYREERILLGKDKRELPILKTVTRAEVNGRQLLVESFLDLSESKEVERTLRSAEEKTHQILENINIGVALIGPDMEILELNRQMRNWFQKIDLETKPICYQAFNDPPRQGLCEYCPTILTLRDGFVHESTTQTPQGERVRNYRVVSSPIHDSEGRVVAAIEMVEDVTEKLTLEKELRQAQKLESIGQLAAGIAHEINTPTQYVGDNTRFLQDAFQDLIDILKLYEQLLEGSKKDCYSDALIRDIQTRIDEADLEYLEEEIPLSIKQTLEGVGSISKIVRSMKEFSHPGSDEKMLVDINRALESTITVAKNEWKYVAEMKTDFDPLLPPVPCFPGELNQVFLNIIINAAHAIGDVVGDGSREKGAITIGTKSDGDSVEIRFGDTGCGIPQNIQHRIFDPFFTTKGVGKGTGQGLSIAHMVITEKHKGSLKFETKEGEGATFIIRLPLHEADQE